MMTCILVDGVGVTDLRSPTRCKSVLEQIIVEEDRRCSAARHRRSMIAMVRAGEEEERVLVVCDLDTPLDECCDGWSLVVVFPRNRSKEKMLVVIAAFRPTMVCIFEGPLLPVDCIDVALQVRSQRYLTAIIGASVSFSHGAVPDVVTVSSLGELRALRSGKAGREAPRSWNAKAHELSDRDREVLRLLYEGAIDKEIAARLDLPLSTIKYILRQLCRQYRVNSRALLVRCVAEFRLLDCANGYGRNQNASDQRLHPSE